MDRRVIFSPVGLLAAVILFVVVNLATGPALRWARIDLTQGDLHSLSDGTINILQKLESTITMKLWIFWIHIPELILTPHTFSVKDSVITINSYVIS